MSKLTLIDGSSLIYSACYNTSQDKNKSDNFTFYKETLDYYIESILKVTEADFYIVFGDSPSSYRKRLFDTFKSDRVKTYIKFKYDLLEYSKNRWNLFIHNDLESDDMCLITHNQFKNIYDITIASKDSDLRQYSARFFNYGIFRYPTIDISEGFEEISEEQAEYNLWKQVLVKGHNNKVDYLENCGDACAESFLKKWKNVSQYRYAVMKAYIEGLKDIRKSVIGYGLCMGIDKFNKSFKQTYLFRKQEELNEIGITFKVPEFYIFKNPINDDRKDEQPF
jgi:hypothetical protein